MYERPDNSTNPPTHIQAWEQGYKTALAGDLPNLDGLFRGEEVHYITGYNRRMLEKNQVTYRLVRDDEDGMLKIHPNDSGNQTSFKEESKIPGGEVRTTSSSGGMKGVKPERFSLIPVDALASVARLYGFGATKYAAHNWRKGYEYSKSYDSLFRHATESLNGNDIDEETGEPHLAGVVFHALTLMSFELDKDQYGMFDDRYKPSHISNDVSSSNDDSIVIEVDAPLYTASRKILSIPQIIGAVYYLNDKHVIGDIAIGSDLVVVKVKALPGYTIDLHCDTSWNYRAA